MILPHYENLLDQICKDGWSNDSEMISVSKEALKDFLRYIANTLPFDERFYLISYPDVQAAIKTGQFQTGKEHYLAFGIFEGRLPSIEHFDHREYASTYEDVAESTDNLKGTGKKNKLVSHFVEFGFAEGRNVDIINRKFSLT